MKKLSINLGSEYNIYFLNNLLKHKFLINYLKNITKKLVIITDSNLKDCLAIEIQIFLKNYGIDCQLLYFSAGESYKTRETKEFLENQLLDSKFTRDTLIIAIGGGVVTDMAGFIASTYCRGVSVIYIPTTLLAMVDASIGGKTGVNTDHGKNMIGAFYQPNAVIIDFKSLNSLPDREFKNGLVEVIKHYVLADYKLFRLIEKSSYELIRSSNSLLEKIVFSSCCIKKEIVEQDEKEGGIRQLLNFGHTIGHAVEIIENYDIYHGEAVAIGMVVESYISHKMQLLSQEKFLRLYNLLKSFQLPFKTSAFNDKVKFKELLLLDKKTRMNLPKIILLKDLGKAQYTLENYSFTPPEEILDDALDWAVSQFN
jgi:3-dehydroquinate synthase